MSKTEDTIEKLAPEEVAALQLVTIAPAPRTAEELANSYGGQREANLWPEQSPEDVKRVLKALERKKLIKKGAKAPDDQPTLELTAAADDAQAG